MSTTIEVYPQTSYIPTFAEILDLAESKLRGFLTDIGCRETATITVTLHVKTPDRVLPLDLAAPLRWSEDEYAWFQVPPVPGGTDAYFRIMDDIRYKGMVAETTRSHPLVQRRKAWMKACLAQGYYWYFRRSIYQPAVINLAYGMLAAAVAECTSGFLYSSDGAWDYGRFPATAAEFTTWYFRPVRALDWSYARWARRCITDIPEELRTGKTWSDVPPWPQSYR